MSRYSLAAMSILAVALTSAAFAGEALDGDGAASANGAPGWSGIYLGADLGYGMGSTQLVVDGVFEWNAAGSRGGSVGAFAGYNHQFGDWVAGFEFGGTLSDVQGHTEFALGSDVFGTQTLTDWSAGLSARLGYLVSPSTLLFARVGGKIYHGIGRAKINGATVYEEDDQFVGIGTVSVGIETALSDRLRVRAQYDADLLNTIDYDFLAVTPLVGTARASLIYAFGDPAGTGGPADAEEWRGFYGGVVAGQSLGVASIRVGDDIDYLNHEGLGSSGWTGGVVAGYNLNVTERILLGIEAGAYASTLRSFIGSALEEDGLEGTNDWWVDARIRAGYLPSQQAMVYGFVGATRTHSTIALLDNGVPVDESPLDRNGATFGAGIEAQLTDDVLVRAEYAYTVLEAADLVVGIPDAGSMAQTQQTATVGLLYRFGD